MGSFALTQTTYLSLVPVEVGITCVGGAKANASTNKNSSSSCVQKTALHGWPHTSCLCYATWSSQWVHEIDFISLIFQRGEAKVR